MLGSGTEDHLHRPVVVAVAAAVFQLGPGGATGGVDLLRSHRSSELLEAPKILDARRGVLDTWVDGRFRWWWLHWSMDSQ